MKFLILLLIVVSCSGITILNTDQFYSKEFLKKIESIQLIYKDGDKKLANQKLKRIPDTDLSKDEKAKKYNLLGVMAYRAGNINLAIENFLNAKQNLDRDPFLTSQVRLNLANGYFKSNQIEQAYEQIKKIDTSYVEKKNLKNFHKLRFTLANQLGDQKNATKSLVYLAGGIKSFAGVDNFSYKEVLIDNYKKMSDTERVYFLEEKAEGSPYVIAYLGRMEALSRLYKGDRNGAEDVVSWLDGKFGNLEEISSFVKDFKFRIDNFSKINPRAIGLITSLSGKTKRWGQQALTGVNTALSQMATKEDLFKIYIKDNQNNPYLSRNHVKELVEKHHVSVIIGGLFPDLAKEEYLEARKYGVLYISLSPVYLPRSEKSHLLIEVAGSVESQIHSLLKNPSIKAFGDKVSILYPDNDEGQSYLNELWTLDNLNQLDLVNSNQFERGIKDYREPVKKLLGLKFPRERKEEFQIWKEIKNIKKENVRVINVLPPVVDFDWVFIPSLPSEAIQIIPTFGYFDAGRVKFVGGPSWINNTLKEQRRSLGEMYVIGNDTTDISQDFVKMYRDMNKKMPHLIDTMSFDAMKVALGLLQRKEFEDREGFEGIIKEAQSLKGVTSEWFVKDGLWFKRMDILKINSDGFKKVAVEAN